MLDKLIREVARAETQAIEHAPREARRIGDAAPVFALRDVANHATAMRARFVDVLHAHEIPMGRSTVGATLATLRQLVVDRVHDAERAYRTALLDLRHGIDVVKLLREVARTEELFAVIRWCDDWLGARRTLVARVEAQLAWFAEDADVDLGIAPAPVSEPLGEDLAEDFEGSREPGGHPDAIDR